MSSTFEYLLFFLYNHFNALEIQLNQELGPFDGKGSF